jgi:hypothetical protein
VGVMGLPGIPGMMGGDPQGGQQNGGSTQNVAEVSPQNPSQTGPAEENFSTGNVSVEDQQMLVHTISEYRNSWSQDRLERIRQWMENLFYWRGIQVIRWDTATNCWYDVLAWARTQNQDSGEDTDLERWINPLTLMFCNVFTATMSRAVPKGIIKPQNADPSLKDTVTAKAAVEAVRIMESQNGIRSMIRSIYEMLFLFGCYFTYTRPVIDGEMFGYDDEATFEDMQITTGPHYVCPNCGTETPATSADGMACPNCGAFMGPESFYGAGEGNRLSLKQSGSTRKPRAGVKQTLISCLEMDVDPKSKGKNPLKQTPIAAYDVEIDFGEACMMFPRFRDQLQPGAEVSTTANASVEKLSRLDAVSALGGMTADNSLQNPTFSRVWMQPMSYYKLKDFAFAQRMTAMFPEGLMISMVGEIVVDIRAAVLTKELSHCALYANQGVYCNALANTAVSFNARFNRTMWILDDWATRAAVGMNFADAARIDTEKMSGKPVPAGTMIPVPMRVNGEARPLTEAIMHFDLPINPALWNYPMMLMTFCELILGIPRQLSGQGTQDDVETLGGQQLQLARAQTTLKPYFENVQDERAHATQNMIECLQQLMKTGAVKEIRDVVEAQGGAYQNNNVDWTKMQGNVNVVPDEDQDLPVSPEELRTAIQTMFTELSKGNPAAAEWFAVPANQDLALSTMVPNSVCPDEAQRQKTEADIQSIVENGPQIKMNPDGSKGTELPVHPDKTENFPVAKEIIQRYMLEHFELRKDNPTAWLGLIQFYDELQDADMQTGMDHAKRQQAVTQAGAPPAPQPNPQMQAEMQQLIQAAQQAIQRLTVISGADPRLTGGKLTDQTKAASEIVSTTVDAAKLMNGGK